MLLLWAPALSLYCQQPQPTLIAHVSPQVDPSCFVIFDLEPFLFDFVFNFEIFKSFPCLSLSSLPSCDLVSLTNMLILCIILKDLKNLLDRVSSSKRSSNTDVLDLPCLLVLITGTSQSRQHEDDDRIFTLDEPFEEMGSEAIEVPALKEEKFAQITVLGLCVSFPNGEALSFVL
ncbi:hypothetical protein Tco_1079763 [Tanacetum coccineum]|uniref:Uncharacterized protein n=1 Tax=Tanacetum coccineum TaxID=301880 RepID=A0ABQ5HST3_9ASTR